MSGREQIDAFRRTLERLPSRTPDDQEILLDFRLLPDERTAADAGNAVPQPQVQVATLTIKSGAKNALSGKMMSQLTERLDELEAWAAQVAEEEEERGRPDACSGAPPARCLLVRGHGGTFCSGSDLTAVRGTLGRGAELAALMQHNFARLAALPVLSVAYLEGYALGGGAEFALAADLRIMAESAKLGFVHARNGICCGWGGSVRLVRLVGPARALELLASGRLVGRDEALRLGLACELGPPRRADPPARQSDEQRLIQFCREHAARSAPLGRALKAAVRAALELPTERALELERALFASTWGGPAHLRALDTNAKHNK